MTDRAWTERTRQRAREKFLKELAERGIVLHAAESAGISRSTAYVWRDADEEFAKAWNEAVEVANDRLVAEAWRRGVEGVEEPVFGRVEKDKDGQIGTIRKYSDAMLDRLLKARRPSEFRERQQIEHTGEVVKVYAGFDPDKV